MLLFTKLKIQINKPPQMVPVQMFSKIFMFGEKEREKELWVLESNEDIQRKEKIQGPKRLL